MSCSIFSPLVFQNATSHRKCRKHSLLIVWPCVFICFVLSARALVYSAHTACRSLLIISSGISRMLPKNTATTARKFIVSTKPALCTRKIYCILKTSACRSRGSAAVHYAGSPFLLNVRPTVACDTLSTITKMAISLSTAGFPALFTMQTRDEFNNQGETSGDPYDYALMQGSTLPTGSSSQDDSKDGGTLKFQGTLSYISGGGYNLRYTATLRGTFGLRGKILQCGGLFGTYFENDDLTDNGQLAWNPDQAATLASFQRIDSTIYFVWRRYSLGATTGACDLPAQIFAFNRGSRYGQLGLGDGGQR